MESKKWYKWTYLQKQKQAHRYEITDWYKIKKGVCQDCILSPSLFNLNVEYIMWHARLDEAQVGIKIARRNINNLSYADDITLMAESKVELKSLLMRVNEKSEKAGFKLNIQKTKIMASGPITSWQIIDGGKWKQWHLGIDDDFFSLMEWGWLIL